MDLYRFSVFLLPAIALILALFFLVPQTLRSFQNWKKTEKPISFSEFVILISLASSLLIFTYLVALQYSIHYEKNLPNEILKFIFGIALILLTAIVFIPQSLRFFRSWQKKDKPIDLSMAIFFGFLSFYSLSLLFSKLIISALGLFSNET